MSVVLGIVTGMVFEAELVRDVARKRGVPRPLIEVAGLGPGRAMAAAGRLIDRGASHLLSFGLAAALDPGLDVGAVVVAEAVVEASGSSVPCDPAWSARLAAATEARRGKLATTPVVLTGVSVKASLREHTGAVAADMESGGVAEAAVAARKAFAVLRVVSDTADQPLPPTALAAMDQEGSVRIARVIGALLRAPTQIPSLMRLGRSTAVARRRLAALADVGLARGFFAELGDK